MGTLIALFVICLFVADLPLLIRDAFSWVSKCHSSNTSLFSVSTYHTFSWKWDLEDLINKFLLLLLLITKLFFVKKLHLLIPVANVLTVF